VVNQFVTVFIFGLGSATSVIIGNTIGEGNYEKVKEYSVTITILSLIMGIVAGFIIYIISPYVVDLYNVSDSTKEIAKEIMSVSSIIVVFQALSINTMMGILRGGGDNKFVLINDVLFMWQLQYHLDL
jgi:Na+-driven multidrug efflux pump